MRLASNQGKAEAVRRGILEAITDGPALVGFWDADLSTPLTVVDDFLDVAAKRPDVDLILGSRVLLMGRDIRRRARRHYVGRVFATAASLALDLPVYDTQCGAKVFRVNEALRRVMSAPFRSPWVFDVEILARYVAVPVDDGGPPRRVADLRTDRAGVARRARFEAQGVGFRPLDWRTGGRLARAGAPDVVRVGRRPTRRGASTMIAMRDGMRRLGLVASWPSCSARRCSSASG